MRLRRFGPGTASELLALAAALVPIVVAVVRAAAQQWMPIGDAAYFTVRSRDVLTAHHPLLGAWSSGSSVVGASVNNLGSLQLNLLAPFTKPWPYLGTGIGSAVINAASVTLVWLVARRMFRPAVVAVVMVGTLLLLSTLGLSWLIDARQQHAMVLPFFALLWLTAGMWIGVGFAVPLGVAVASLVAQTHFTYAYQTAIVTAAGIAWFLVVCRRRGMGIRDVRRVGLWTIGVGAACWIQPLIDQFFGTGNLGTVLGSAGDREGAGFGSGVQVLAGGSLTPPLWLPGSMDGFLLPHDGVTYGGAVSAVAIWLAACGTVAVIGARSRSVVARSSAASAAVALVAAVIAASRIPVSSFGLMQQNYYWVWSVGAFVTIVLLAGLLSLPSTVTRLHAWSGTHRRVILAAGGVAALGLAVWPRYPVESVAVDEVETDRVARPLAAELRTAIAAGVVDDTVEVDLGRAFFGNDYPYVMLAELQRAGIEFRFVPEVRGVENTNLKRFGTSRCADGGQFRRLLIIAGPDPRLEPGSEIVAEIVGISDAELAELRTLQARFGDLLRAGDVAVDLERVRFILGANPDTTKVEELLATEEMPAEGLARSLQSWRGWGYVEVPSAEREAFDRWFELEHRSIFDYQTVVLENPIPSEGTC